MKMINAEPLYQWLAMESDLERISQLDAIFIVGGSPSSATQAALIEKAMGKPIPFFFTSAGGNFGANITHGKCEVDLFAERLLQHRVDPKLIHTAPQELWTTNTLEEARVGMKFVQNKIKDVRNVLLCARSIHSRRAWATFARQNPEITFWNAPDGESLTVELLPRIVQEVERLDLYGSRGDLLAQTLPNKFEAIVAELREHLTSPRQI